MLVKIYFLPLIPICAGYITVLVSPILDKLNI